MAHEKLPGSGKSSFDLVDHELVFKELGLAPGAVFLDLGCGMGDYALAAAEKIGPHGLVYAADGWQEGIAILERRARDRNLTNIQALVARIPGRLPLSDQSVDICLMATVLHDFARDANEQEALQETARVLKQGGVLGVVEFKKVDKPPGPPIQIRLDPSQVEAIIRPFGFRPLRTVDAGAYTYCTIARKEFPT